MLKNPLKLHQKTFLIFVDFFAGFERFPKVQNTRSFEKLSRGEIWCCLLKKCNDSSQKAHCQIFSTSNRVSHFSKFGLVWIITAFEDSNCLFSILRILTILANVSNYKNTQSQPRKWSYAFLILFSCFCRMNINRVQNQKILFTFQNWKNTFSVCPREARTE